MIVIIDGYNLLRQVFPKIKGSLDPQRKQLIKQLIFYKLKKEKDIQEIILVFDAGPFGHATREIKSGVIIIFSGQKSSADEWILRYTRKNKHKEILLITLDRELIRKCEKTNTHSMNVYEFYKILQKSLLADKVKEFHGESLIRKYENKDLEEFPYDVESESLDFLMNEASRIVPYKKDDISEKRKTKGSSKKLSRKERSIYSKIKKLR